MTHTLVLFDIDGTLLDAGGSGSWAMTRAFEDVFDLKDAERFSGRVRFDGMTDPGIIEAIARNAGVPDHLLAQQAACLKTVFLAHLERRLRETPGKRALPGVKDLLDRLVGVHHATIGLATGNARRGAMLKLSAVGLADYFDLGAFGDDAPDRTSIGRIARERVEREFDVVISPDDVVLVGDSVPDIEAAHANGYRSLAVGTGWSDLDTLKAANPGCLVDDLADFGSIMRFIFGSRG